MKKLKLSREQENITEAFEKSLKRFGAVPGKLLFVEGFWIPKKFGETSGTDIYRSAHHGQPFPVVYLGVVHETNQTYPNEDVRISLSALYKEQKVILNFDTPKNVDILRETLRNHLDVWLRPQ